MCRFNCHWYTCVCTGVHTNHVALQLRYMSVLVQNHNVMRLSGNGYRNTALVSTVSVIGASLSEPLLVASTAALSIWWYVRTRTSFRKCSTSRFMRMMLCTAIRSTFDLDLHMYVDAQARREARLSRRRERERRNRALESAEEREARLARRRVTDRALPSCTVYCPARRSSTTQKGAQIPRRVYVRTYVRTSTFYGRICAAMGNIRKLAQARPNFSSNNCRAP